MNIGQRWQPSRRLALVASGCVAMSTIGLGTASAGPSVTELGAVTTIHVGSLAGSTIVSVPKAVPFGGQCDAEPQVAAVGSADAATVALLPLGVKTPIPTLFGRLPRREGGHTYSSLCGEGSQLAPGTYKLVALRTAGSMSLVLHLPGLTGRVSLAPGRAHAATKFVNLPLLHPYSPTTGGTSYATTGRLAAKGFLMVVGWNRVAGDAATTNGDCEVSEPESTQLPLEATEAPGCPLGSSGMSYPTVSSASKNFWIGGESNVDSGVYAAGYFVMSSSAPTSSGALAMWVPFGA